MIASGGITNSLAVLVRCFGVVLLKHGCVLREQTLFLLFDDVGLVLVRSHFGLPLGKLDGALLPVDHELLLPEALDLASVLQFAHAALLLGHLLEALVLGKLRQQFVLEVLLEAFLLGSALGFQAHLEVLGLLELAASLVLLVLGLLLALAGCQLVLLHVQLVAQVLTELVLGAAGHLLLLEAAEDGVTGGLGLVLGGLNLVQPLLLLLGVLAHHLVLVSLHLLLTLDQGTLLVHGEDHVGLGLLHFEVLDAGHLPVLTNHALDDGVDLVALLEVLLAGLDFKLLAIDDLLLDVGLVAQAVLLAGLLSLALDLVLDLLGAEHDLVDLGVLLLRNKYTRVKDSFKPKTQRCGLPD